MNLMKSRLGATLSIALAAALCAAAPAYAQRASLADRVTTLEQQAANNQGNMEMLNQINQLRNEVQALRGQIEQLQQEAEQSKASGRSQYLDLDSRLNRLEGGATAPAPAATTSSTTSPPAETPPASTAKAGTESQVSMVAKPTADERGAYENAFSALKEGNYVESARRFQTFIQNFPSASYTPNAVYWLGESYYVTQNYEMAQQQFRHLLDTYPNHDKAPGAMLKLGLSESGLKQTDAARKTLNDVITRYPGTDAARAAEDRLRSFK